MSCLSHQILKHFNVILITSLSYVGLCRTCEIFGVSELVISNLKVLDDKLFQNLSVTSDKWIKVTEVN